MNKSIQDIENQTERVIALAEHSWRFKSAKFGIHRSTIYKVARVAKTQHGFSVFETDKTTKKPCIHPYVNQMHTLTPYWDTQEYKDRMTALSEKWAKERAEKEEKRKAAMQYTREQIEQRMNAIVDAQMMLKVLAWIQDSIIIHTQLGLGGDPYDVPRKLLATCMDIIPHDGNQLKLFE